MLNPNAGIPRTLTLMGRGDQRRTHGRRANANTLQKSGVQTIVFYLLNPCWIGVGNGSRRPLPPNPVCGFPATGPRLTATQLPSTTELWPTPAGTCTLPIARHHGRTPKSLAGIQSTFAPDALTTGAHFLISASMNFANSCGVLPLGMAPCASSFSLTAGLASALATSC